MVVNNNCYCENKIIFRALKIYVSEAPGWVAHKSM